MKPPHRKMRGLQDRDKERKLKLTERNGEKKREKKKMGEKIGERKLNRES